MEVVDLGTRFELSVDRDSNEAHVSVTEGLVDLHLGGEGAPPGDPTSFSGTPGSGGSFRPDSFNRRRRTVQDGFRFAGPLGTRWRGGKWNRG